MSLVNYNKDINPIFPFLCVHPELLNGQLENFLQSDIEKVLFTGHILIDENEGIIVLSNKRFIIYQTVSSTDFLERAWLNLIIGSMPGIGELIEIKGTLTGVRDNLNTIFNLFNRKAKKRKEAKAEQEQLDKLAKPLTLPEDELLNSKEFELIVNNSWSLLNTFGTQIRINKKRLIFEKRSEIQVEEDGRDYYVILKKAFDFYHEYIDVVMASLFLPNRELFQKLGWDIFYEGNDLIIANANHKVRDSASEEIFINIEKHNLFGVSSDDSPFVHLTLDDIPNIEPSEFRDSIENGISFLQGADWVNEIQKVYLDKRSSKGVVVLFFEILPNSEDIDKLIWVIGGFLPLTAFAASAIPTTIEALDFYSQEAKKWIANVRGESESESKIFFNLDQTKEVAGVFEELLDIFINEELPAWGTLSPN